MKNYFKKITALVLILVFTTIPVILFAQSTINLNAPNLLPKSEIFISPRSSTFLVGSTFEAPIYINTRGSSINAINLKINYDPKKLSIVNPSGGKSIFGIWVEPPQYDNARGTASLAGVVPGGIVTSSGLIITMTFKVLSSGETRVTISDQTTVNANDGLGSEILLTRSGANYILQNPAPSGANIYSDTHPLQDVWYNNSSPIFEWDTEPGTNGFSVSFDNTAQTIPSNEITHKEATSYYENIKDGIWYLHVKKMTKGIWGATSHFKINVDTMSPADFSPEVSSFKDEDGNKKYLISFFTTDTMSGVSRYEIGLIDKKSINEASPVFVETESPYLVPKIEGGALRVIVRAYDSAGNTIESHVDLYPGFTFVQSLKKIGVYLLALAAILLLLELLLHYLFGHHIIDHIKKAYRVFKNSEKEDENNAPIV